MNTIISSVSLIGRVFVSAVLVVDVVNTCELIVSKYVAESITMIAGRFGHEGLCQLRTELVQYLNSSVRS